MVDLMGLDYQYRPKELKGSEDDADVVRRDDSAVTMSFEQGDGFFVVAVAMAAPGDPE